MLMYYNRQVVISIKIKATNKMSSYDYKFMNYRHIEKSNVIRLYIFIVSKPIIGIYRKNHVKTNNVMLKATMFTVF